MNEVHIVSLLLSLFHHDLTIGENVRQDGQNEEDKWKIAVV